MNDVALQTPNAQLRYMKLLSWIIVNLELHVLLVMASQ